MDQRELEFVVAVAEELNFTRAAQRCHIAQSGLSHRIAQLEREIGATLFERSSRKVLLTPEGHVFLPYARRMLRDAEDVQAELAALRGVVRGRLRLGSIPVSVSGVDLLGLLRDYRKAYPESTSRCQTRGASARRELFWPAIWTPPSWAFSRTSCPPVWLTESSPSNRWSRSWAVTTR